MKMTLSKNTVLPFVAALCCFFASPVMAQENCGQALNLEDVDVREVIDEIALRTGRKFVLDQTVQGRVSIKSGPDTQLCATEAWELFQAALGAIGYTAAPIRGNNYRIIPVQEGARVGGPLGEGNRGDFVTQIVRLQYVDAREAAANLAQIVSERGVVAPVRSGNAVILVDTAENIIRLQKVLQRIDRDTSVYRTIPLEFASAAEVAQILNELAQEISEDGGSASEVSIVPAGASNSILIRGEPAILDRLAGVVAELDRVGETKSDLLVIALNHSDAEEMAVLLREVASAQENDGERRQGRAAISFHTPTNSVIVSGDANIQRTLKNVVAQLDVRRAQVLVEAIIVEVSDDTARELGIQYFISGSEGSQVPFSTTNFASARPNILAAAGAAILDDRDGDSVINDAAGSLADAAVASLLGVNGFALGGAGQTSNGTLFGAILTAIKQDNTSKVLSTPSVVTLDNQLATLSVGQEIPITTGEAVGDDFSNAFRTVSREQVGVILEVTPQINEGGTVKLEIRQETSSISSQIISTSTDLITNKREISTTALIDDGEILVIGGLIDEQSFNTENKVPLLGDIPVAGNLFKTSAKGSNRRNLMVFIRPTILRDRDTAKAATQKKMNYIRAREILSSGNATSGLERLIEQATGAAASDDILQ